MVRGNGFFKRRWQHHALITAKSVDGKYQDYKISAFDDPLDLTREAISQVSRENRDVLGAYEDLSWAQIQTLDQMVCYANQGRDVGFDIRLKDQPSQQTF